MAGGDSGRTPYADQLGDEFDRLARERAAVPSPRRRLAGRRSAAFAAGFVLFAAGGAGAARLLTAPSEVVRPERRLPASIIRAERDTRLSPIRIRDPLGGRPWSARTYASRDGRTCLIAGQVEDGVLGVSRGRRFAVTPSRAPGTCGDLYREHLLLAHTVLGAPARTVVFGAVDRSVASVTLRVDRHDERVQVGGDGTFVAVLGGRVDAARLTVRALGAGRTIVRPFVPSRHPG